MIAKFIDTGDLAWTRCLSRMPHDFYNLPDYVDLCSKHEGGVATAFYAEEGQSTFLAPLLVRSIPTELGAPCDWQDCLSPYGYSTPVIIPSQDMLPDFLDAFCRKARLRGIVTAFFRLHPLLTLDQGALRKFGQLIRHGETVYFDLTQSKEVLWDQVSMNHRRNIKKLVRLGFQVSFDDWTRLPDFISLYYATMRRVQAGDAYFFSGEYFEDLRVKLGDRLHLACALTETGETASAGLFVSTDGIVQYHLGGTAPAYLALAPFKLVIDFMWRWAQERSHRALHLGGGVGGSEDSLFDFKAGFSSMRGEFYTYRIIVDHERNRILEQAAGIQSTSSDPKESVFFPRYRHVERYIHSP